MLFLSASFSVMLVAFRVVYWGKLTFTFFVWNLFLAVIPLLISRKLAKQERLSIKAIIAFFCWLIFLPNAPYIITDIHHFEERPPVSIWYDLLLISSAAWNGLMLGIVSLLQVEEFLRRQFSTVKVHIIMFFSILSCAYGVYVGRFLRFNSWDVVTNPDDVIYQLGRQFLHPHEHVKVWAFTLSFAAMLSLVYYTFRRLHRAAAIMS